MENEYTYMLKRLQRVQTSTPRYAFRRYATINDIFSLKWLPIVEFIEFSTVKLVHQAIYAENQYGRKIVLGIVCIRDKAIL